MPEITLPTVDVSENAGKAAGAGKKKAAGFLRNFAAAIKFREKVREKQKQRILEIIGNWGITDSIRASGENIEKILAALSERNEQRYDSLLKLINKLAIDSYIPPPSSGTSGETPAEEPVEEIAAGSEASSAALAPPPGAEKEKWASLTAIRKVMAGAAASRVTVVEKDTERSFELRLARKTPIYGFYDPSKGANLSAVNFSIFSAVVYDRLTIEPVSGHFIRPQEGSSDLLQKARGDGCRILLTAWIGDAAGTRTFLSSEVAQDLFIQDLVRSLKARQADGINIQFPQLPHESRAGFTAFIAKLGSSVHQPGAGFILAVTLPPFDGNAAFDLGQLGGMADVFFDDFTRAVRSSPGPLTALGGGAPASIASSVSFYLGQQLDPSKLVLKLPYTGVAWDRSEAGARTAKLQGYPSYASLRSYDCPVYFEEGSATFRMDSLLGNGTSRTIWFDNETTLSAKYDFILQNGLGGVAVSALGDDGSYGELRDALLYKFVSVDSTLVSQTSTGSAALSLPDRLSRWLALYGYVVRNPCAICFEASGDDSERARMYQYIKELGIDAIVQAERARIDSANKYKKDKEPAPSAFDYINRKLGNTLLGLTVIVGVLSLGLAFFYVNRMRNRGYLWPRRKLFAWLIVGSILVFFLSLFSLLFVSDAIPIFGVSSSAQQGVYPLPPAASPLLAPDSARAEHMQAAAECAPDPGCINMPLGTLLLIVTVTSGITLLATRYLILPFVKARTI